MPLLGRLVLAGRTVSDAEHMIESMASQRLGSDQILISISIIGNTGPIQFAGAVKQSGSVPYRPGMSLGDIVALAEPTVAADRQKVEITGSDGRLIVADLDSGGVSIRVKPGDRVFFPQADGPNEVFVLGSVVRPGSKPFKSGMTVLDAIALAGGTTPHAEVDKVRLVRKGQPETTFSVDDSKAKQSLMRGDAIVVPHAPDGSYVTVSGFVRKPGLIEFRPGMTLTQTIKAAGGTMSLAGVDAVTVKRFGGPKRSFDLVKIGSGEEEDPALQPDDMIEVPMEKQRPVAVPKRDSGKEPRHHPVVPPL